jgi:NAD(P)-dependent dehydrogenase (short-subunit alcohol dehydrogenase family)
VTTLEVDLENWDETKAAVEALAPIHHLVNNAGILRFYPFLEIKPEDFKTYLPFS